MTYNSCGTIKWNNGVSYPIQSGHGCIGCSEENFWDNGPFYERLPSMHGIGIEATADKVGKIALGVVGAGIVIHAIGANFMKRKELARRINRGKQNETRIID